MPVFQRSTLLVPLATATATATVAVATWAPTPAFTQEATVGTSTAAPASAIEVVEFAKGTSEITEGEITSLRSLLTREGSKGIPGGDGGRPTVYVAGWADAAVRDDGRELGNDAVKLADARVRAVRRTLEAVPVRSAIVAVNLAKEPGTLQRLFGTKNAKVGLRALRGRDAGDPDLNEAGRVIEERGGAGKVVVYVQR